MPLTADELSLLLRDIFVAYDGKGNRREYRDGFVRFRYDENRKCLCIETQYLVVKDLSAVLKLFSSKAYVSWRDSKGNYINEGYEINEGKCQGLDLKDFVMTFLENDHHWHEELAPTINNAPFYRFIDTIHTEFSMARLSQGEDGSYEVSYAYTEKFSTIKDIFGNITGKVSRCIDFLNRYCCTAYDRIKATEKHLMSILGIEPIMIMICQYTF